MVQLNLSLYYCVKRPKIQKYFTRGLWTNDYLYLKLSILFYFLPALPTEQNVLHNSEYLVSLTPEIVIIEM